MTMFLDVVKKFRSFLDWQGKKVAVHSQFLTGNRINTEV